MGIYKSMEENWNIYCLMSAIAYIEEMSKPTEHIQIKNGKKYVCFHCVRLKMNNPEFTKEFFDITKTWEKKKGVIFIGKTFDKVRKEPGSNQDFFYLGPNWINQILVECGKIPNEYSFDTAIKRIAHMKQYQILPIDKNKTSFDELLINKRLAAGAFIISMDLECRGIQQGRPSLCMSEKFKDFLEFMLKVAKKWNWTNNSQLSQVKVDYNINRGINASPQWEFRINIEGLKEIYLLAGPLANSLKEKCISFHVNRSRNYDDKGDKKKKGTHIKLLNAIREGKNLTTTQLQFVVNTGTDVVLEHLHRLEKEGKIKKERKGKKYIWNIKNVN